MPHPYPQAALVLADGKQFFGRAIAARGNVCAEVVFHTGMTGYQEILTDPSYSQQIVCLTYPHIGNTGSNSEDDESGAIQASALIIRELSLNTSNFRSQQSLTDYLNTNNIIAVDQIDTRALTRHIRNHGAQAGCLTTAEAGHTQLRSTQLEQALSAAQQTPSLAGLDLAKQVSTPKPYVWNQGLWQLHQGHEVLANINTGFHVVALDFGIKRNILRYLAQSGARITVLPAQSTLSEVLAYKPDAVFLSNGPGDPAACHYAIKLCQQLLEKHIPLFGICLGHQILALACGAKTFKMRFGHHGANHPVQELSSKRVSITSQNHGFAVEKESLPACLEPTHVSLFDGVLQGFKHRELPAMGFQGHPEASPGPHDIAYLFDQFANMVAAKRTH